jgi:hypothetical protein
MGCYVEHIRTTTASNDIFPSVALGFTDTVQAVREETVKSMVLLAPKLNGNILNNQLLKYLAKLQMDEVVSCVTYPIVTCMIHSLCLFKVCFHNHHNNVLPKRYYVYMTAMGCSSQSVASFPNTHVFLHTFHNCVPLPSLYKAFGSYIVGKLCIPVI